MKYLTLLSLMLVLFYSGCTEEETPTPDIINFTPLIAKELVGDFEKCVYTYEDGLMQNMIFRRSFFDPVTQSQLITATLHGFYYSEDRLDRIVVDGNIEYQFTYPGNDLQITEVRNGEMRLQLRFTDYLADNISTINVVHPLIMLDGQILTLFDDNLNVSSATDENGIKMEEAYTSPVGNMYNFFGDMEYDDQKSPYTNLSPELQLWFNWNKNANNLLRKETENAIWEFEYAYNEDGHPVASTRTVQNLDDNTIVVDEQVTYEYTY